MNKLEKSQKELFAISKKYETMKKQSNISDAELQSVRNEFNQAVSNWCKLDEYYKANPIKKNQVKVIIDSEPKEAVLKRKFEVFNHQFAVVEYPRELYKNANSFYSQRMLIHLPTGGGIGMFSNKGNTLKSFVENSIDTIQKLYVREGAENFNQVLNSYPTIN